MYAGESAEAKLIRFERQENCSLSGLSALMKKCGISGASEAMLSRVMQGRSLDTNTSLEVYKILILMEAIRDAARPLKLNWKNADEVKTWIDAFEAGKLRVNVEFDHPMEDQSFVIHYSGGFLTGFDARNRPIIGDENRALVFSESKVEQVLKFLTASDLQGVTARPTSREVNTSNSAATLF